jgi:hypothetical protein
MSDTTQVEDAQETPTDDQETPTAYGWCSWHEDYSGGVRLIGAEEQGTGPGRNYFACGPCREENGLIPLADRP